LSYIIKTLRSLLKDVEKNRKAPGPKIMPKSGISGISKNLGFWPKTASRGHFHANSPSLRPKKGHFCREVDLVQQMYHLLTKWPHFGEVQIRETIYFLGGFFFFFSGEFWDFDSFWRISIASEIFEIYRSYEIYDLRSLRSIDSMIRDLEIYRIYNERS